MNEQPEVTLRVDLSPITERMDRIERHLALTPRVRLLRAKEALRLFGGTKSRFYALVGRGEIQQIKYDDADDAVYDEANILAVIEKYRQPKPEEGK